MRGILKKIPNKYYKSVFEIDFLSLKSQGIKLLLIDVDNTLVAYDEPLPTKKVEELYKNLDNLGFEIILVSNNNFKRVSLFASSQNYNYVYKAFKPLKRGYKKALRLASRNYLKEEVSVIGDQFFTDIYGENKMGFYTILVAPVKEITDAWTTRINRYRETKLIKKLKKNYQTIYDEVLTNYEM